MKRITTFFLGCFAAIAALAVPAKRTTLTFTQPDGTTITVMQMGDEFFHYYINVDTGEKLFQQNDGSFIVPSKAIFDERQQMAELKRNATEQLRKAPVMAPKFSCLDPDGTTLDLHGKKRALVLLVSYSNKAWNSRNAEFIPRQMNEVGYSENGHEGSAHDYFYTSSYGQFDLQIDVVGPLTVSKTMSYYGSNNSRGDDSHPAEMVAEACKLAYEQGVDFSDYDWDNDGEIEMVTVIYAGFGEAQGGGSTTIWPHQWYLSEAYQYGDGEGALRLDNTYINKYLVLNEITGTYGTQLDGIGTFCHEFSHSLDLPDIYDTASGSNFGMKNWSLMDFGCYNGGNAVPCAYTAYERAFCGWLDPVELTEGIDIKDMGALIDTAEAYIIRNESVRDEYYLLYNVQQKSFDRELPGHGMMVMHVDYDASAWENNVVNNTASHKRLSFIPADNEQSTWSSGLAGDPYPGMTGNTSLTNTSVPKASLFNKNSDGQKLMSKPIEEIAENDGMISFKFNGGTKVIVEIPEILDASNVLDNGFTATWNPIADPDATYNLEMTYAIEVDKAEPADVELVHEDFTTLKAGQYADVADKLDDYTATPGWTGKRIYVQDGYLKIGSTTIYGYITSPSFEIPSGDITVRFNASDYSGTDDFCYVVRLEGETTDSVIVSKDSQLAHFLDVEPGNYKITLVAYDKLVKNGRFFLYDIAAYNGEFYAEDFTSDDNAIIPSSPNRAVRKRTITVEGLTETSYVFTDLPNPSTCTYRVMAFDADGHPSEWSESATVILGTIDAVSAAVLESDDDVIYDLQGRRVNHRSTNGLYIRNGKVIRF